MGAASGHPEKLLSPHSILETESSAYPATSASGARLQSIRVETALEFLRRFDDLNEVAQRSLETWGAFEDRGALIGACALTRVSDTAFRAQVGVVPERRRLGIGAELLGIMIQRAAEAGARLLTGSCPARCIESQRLVTSLGLVSARRVQLGRAKIVIFVPHLA
jgi:GNAT superfamily N-acetyltransferase